VVARDFSQRKEPAVSSGLHRLLFAGFLLSMFAFAPAVTRAQDPAATPDPFAGVTTVVLAGGSSAVAEGYSLVLLQITMAPGAEIPSHHHPGDVSLTVESGTFGTAFTHGTGTITRAATDGGTAVTEQPETGVEQTLTAGDSLSYGEESHHIMRNAGNDDLVLILSALLASDQPGFEFTE
jgi:quercetin dioxygenase-like cupin family protein